MSAQALVQQIPTNDNLCVDASNRLAETRNAISSLPWNLAVELVADSVGAPVTASLADSDTATTPGSMAHKLGHMHVRSFVTGNQDQYGLGMSWDQFCSDVRAHILMNQYSIPKTSSQRIIENVEMVSKTLNREPANAAEYHRVISEHQAHQARVDYQRVCAELELVTEQASALQHELEQTHDRAHKSESLLESIRQEADELRQGRGIATYQEVTNLKAKCKALSERLAVTKEKHDLVRVSLDKAESLNKELGAVVARRGQSLQRATKAINTLKGERQDQAIVIKYMGISLVALSVVAMVSITISLI